jgi:cytochrome c553
MKLLIKATACLAALLALPVMAGGDPASGEEKSALCASCHGAAGNSTIALWPKLAGQHEPYLGRHLKLIKDGARPVPEMLGITADLSDQDISDLAAYYAAQHSSPGAAEPELVGVGERLYRAGNPDTGVPACMACHGPAGKGNPLAGYPALAAQHAAYVGRMLSRYRSGEMWGEDDELSRVMAEVAGELSDVEIRAVASYVQGLYSQLDE